MMLVTGPVRHAAGRAFVRGEGPHEIVEFFVVRRRQSPHTALIRRQFAS